MESLTYQQLGKVMKSRGIPEVLFGIAGMAVLGWILYSGGVKSGMLGGASDGSCSACSSRQVVAPVDASACEGSCCSSGCKGSCTEVASDVGSETVSEVAEASPSENADSVGNSTEATTTQP